jgi:signal peptidase I
MTSLYVKQEFAPRAIPNGKFAALMSAVLLNGTPFRFQASGFSMSPFIKDGDVITISRVNVKKVSLGDVVAFINPVNGSLSVHRVVEHKTNAYLIKGDNSAKLDSWVGQEQILGRITHVERSEQTIRFSLGPERFLIALFSRYNFLIPGIQFFWPVLRPFLKRHI